MHFGMLGNETMNITRLRKTKTDTKAIVNRALLSGIYCRFVSMSLLFPSV